MKQSLSVDQIQSAWVAEQYPGQLFVKVDEKKLFKVSIRRGWMSAKRFDKLPYGAEEINVWEVSL